MNTNTNFTRTEAEAPESTYSPVAYASLFNKGLERVIEVGKSSLDLALEHNAEVLASCKKALKASSMPGLFLFDLAGQAFEGYVTLQKSLLDLTVEQSTAIIDARVCRDDGKMEAEVTSAVQQSMDFTGAAQSSLADLTPAQAKVVSDIAKQQPGVASKSVQTAEEIQLRVDALLAKEIVDLTVAQQPGKTAQTVEGIVQLQVDTLTAKDIVDLATNQNKAVSDLLKQQPGVTPKSAQTIKDSVPRGVDTRPDKQIADSAKKPSKTKGSPIH